MWGRVRRGGGGEGDVAAGLSARGRGEEWEVTSYKGEELTPGGLSNYQGNHRGARPLPPLS